MNQMVRMAWVVGLVVLGACSKDASLSVAQAVPPTDAPILDLVNTEGASLALHRHQKRPVVLLRLQGEVRHFGYDLTAQPPVGLDYRATVAHAKVYIAEYPISKALNLRTDSTGRWDLYVLKFADDTLDFSFVYEKDFYPSPVEQALFGAALPSGWEVSRGKSNVISITHTDIKDLGMQFPDELYFYYAKTQVEKQVSQLSGVPYELSNAVVVTVGKTWASLFSDSLPHGDPGARTVISPANTTPFQGPIYFDEHVQPNATYQATSQDGGVLYNSLAPGEYSITAVKDPYTYPSVRFVIEEGIRFYVASPPHSIEGSNSSAAKAN